MAIKLYSLFWILSSILGINCYTYPGYSCSAGSYLGVSSPSSYNSNRNTAQTGRLYFVEDSKYLSSCCGVISSWEFYASVTGTIEFVVWRRDSGTKWKITGKNRIYVSSPGLKTYDPSTSALGDYRLSIEPGDYIGWYCLGNDIIPYTSSTSKLTRVRSSVSAVTVGDVTDWSLYQEVDSTYRDYAIKANIATGSSPTINSIGTITMPDSTVAGTVIYSVTYSNADKNDAIYVGVQSQSSAYFDFDTTTYKISPKYSYIPEGSYTMTFVIQDQCENEATQTATITITNVKVTIDNMPTGTGSTVDEGLDTQTTLYNIITTDNSAEDYTYCVLGSSNVPFIVEQKSNTVKTFNINVRDRPQFVYQTTSKYLLEVKCNDGTDTATSTFTVNIQKNRVPYFTNTYWSAVIDAEQVGIGTVIFTLTARDFEGDDIFYSMSCSPSGCPFVLLDSGKIVTSKVLIHNNYASYTLSVTVSDSRQTSDPSNVAVKINNINAKPILNNVPTILSVAENSPLGYSIYKFTASDDDNSDTLTMSMYFSNGEGASIFSFSRTTGLLTTSTWNTINYEPLSTKTFTTYISVGDGEYFDKKTFSLTVENKNEAPFFLQKYYTTYHLEGASQTALPLPSYKYIDPDGDTVTFTFNCGSDSGRFVINSGTGQIKYNQEYDLDKSNIPTMITCTVKITDPAGLYDTATLTINIDHDNEYDPQFTSSNFYFYVDSREFIGEIIGQVYASESDGSNTDDGIFYYSLDQSGLAKEYFGIMNDGSIYVKASLSDLYLGQILVLNVSATDYSGRKQTISVFIEVPTFTTTTASSVAEAILSYATSPENMPFLIGGCVLAGVVGVLAAWHLFKYGSCPNAAKNAPKMDSLLEEKASSPEVPKVTKKTQDKAILDEMFGINSVKRSTDF